MADVPDKHAERLQEKYAGDIPQDVQSVGISLGQHMQQIALYLNPAKESGLAAVVVSAKMAAATAELRALNHVLGF